MNSLEKFGNIPIDNAMLYEAIGSYKFPRNKVANMEKRGELIRLKNGLFVVSPAISRTVLSKELIANHLYGPSYVSFETALSFYGLIPEKVFAIRSATFRRAKIFENSLGQFEYIVVPETYYSIGITIQTVNKQFVAEPEFSFLMASPAKALCDIVLTTKHLFVKSKKSMQRFLEEDLRIDFSVLHIVDSEIIRQCANAGRRKKEMGFLAELLENRY